MKELEERIERKNQDSRNDNMELSNREKKLRRIELEDEKMAKNQLQSQLRLIKKNY